MHKKISSWLLGTLLGICVLALLIVQTALTTPEARSSFAEQTNGLPASITSQSNSYLSEITLQLDGAEPNNSIKILQNGTVIASFNQSPITITVEDNALIEIDGTKIDKDFQVKITATNNNCRIYKNITEITVQKNIAILARILIDE